MGGIKTDPVYSLRKKCLLNFLQKNNIRTGKILDLGCDTGDTTNSLSKLGFDVTAVDLDEKRVEELSKVQENVKILQQDLEKQFQFEDNTFDLIWAGDIIEHLMDTENFVKEIYRVLKPGGRFIVSTPYHGFIKNFMIILLNFDKHFNPSDEHVRFYTLKSLREQLERNNFSIIKFELLGRISIIAKNMVFFCKKSHPKIS
jgi:2-polyprenyl-3-methyl-5-hydroxy-6-metoxy-1,4-benzoquinol methylase